MNDPNAVEHIASITISQKQMHMTEEMHQASKAWLQQLHEWGLILKGAMAIEKGETMRREHEQIMCWIKAPCTKETSDKLRGLFEEYGNMPEPRGPKGEHRKYSTRFELREDNGDDCTFETQSGCVLLLCTTCNACACVHC